MTTNCMSMFEVDLKKLDLNARINGVSPKHRGLKNHFIRVGVLHANSPRKIEMQKDNRHSSTIEWAQNQATIIQTIYGAV